MNKTAHAKKRVLQALNAGFGNVSEACQTAKIGRTTFYEWMREDEEFRQAVANVQEMLLDVAESQLHRQIGDGNTVALIFFLKTKGRGRGYSEKVEAPPTPDKAFQDLVTYFAELDRKQDNRPPWLDAAPDGVHRVIFENYSKPREFE